MADFKVGDLVKLKSGGPPMTVVRVPLLEPSSLSTCPEDYHCNWFSGGKLESDWFKPESLEPAQLKYADEDEGGSLEPNL